MDITYISPLILNGSDLTLITAAAIAAGSPIAIDEAAETRLSAARRLVEEKAVGHAPAYGINTGYGWLSGYSIPSSQLLKLQKNLLRSHAAGIGPLLSIEETRLAMALRLNVLLKGYSGVRYCLCQKLCELINAKIYPCIPTYGSVGASGDLIPLAHLALPLIGEGKVHFRGKIQSAKSALKRMNIAPLQLEAKEGLSLINGTQIMLAVGILALHQALLLLASAEMITALTFEGVKGRPQSLDPLIHELRLQQGQIISAALLRRHLKGSYLYDDDLVRKRLQDPYSLRCAPQVHGASRDLLTYAVDIFQRELNAVTDNPIVDPARELILSGGNFHGQPLALAADVAAIAIAELGNISERRLEVLINPHMSGLNAFLAPQEGLNSGYMTYQYLAASLVNENKILCHPASTDSIPGNVGIEDHVSMGMTAVRKLRQVVINTHTILALELMAAAQAVDLCPAARLGEGSQQAYHAIRRVVPMLKNDRILAPDIALCQKVVLSLAALSP